MNHSHLARIVAIAFGAALLVAGEALASPPESVWVEDLILHPSGPAELAMGYDYIEPDTDLADAALDIITLRTASGFDRAPLDFQPSLGLIQGELIGASLAHFGLRVRARLGGTPKEPTLGLVLGYRLHLAGGHGHDLEQGLAGRVHFNRVLSWNYELRARQRFGDGTHVEARAGTALSYGMALDLVRLGVEAFALFPVYGDRLTDYAAGGDADGIALYVGPSLRMHMEYMWFDMSAVTGRILPDGADVMVRTVLGTQF